MTGFFQVLKPRIRVSVKCQVSGVRCQVEDDGRPTTGDRGRWTKVGTTDDRRRTTTKHEDLARDT